ncbi:MAG: DUF4270 family protein [Saprospiraceae bacterium]|nr:DUF4270 family protein [Saprospiraceae bacterium]
MMQKRSVLAVLVILSLFGLWTACSRPTAFGSDLLGDETADYDYTDTLTVQFTLEREDSLLTSDRSSTTPYFLCGALKDPIVGDAGAQIYSLLQLGVLDPGFDKNRHKIDSVVLYLHYKAEGVYGDTMQPLSLKVSRLDEALAYDGNYYSTQSIPASTEIGRIDQFLPRPRTLDSLFSTTSRAAFLRVKLDQSFGDTLLYMDSLALTDDTLFYKALRGIKIEVAPVGGSAPGSILAFNLNDPVYSRLRMYYTQDDTLKTFFDYFFEGCNKFVHFDHNYTGTQAGQLIDKPADNLMYLQGMNGLRLKMVLPYIDKLENIVVNDADLILTTADVNGDLPILSKNPADQLIMTYSVGDTSYFFTQDVNYSIGLTGTNGFDLFGGYPVETTENGVTFNQYKLALSDRLQSMIDNNASTLNDKTIFISVYPQNRIAMRSILYGPKSTLFPAKIALKYTRL